LATEFNATYKTQLSNFDFTDKVSRTGGRILRFTFSWSVTSPNFFHGQEEEGCLAMCNSRGEITWHPPMSQWGKGAFNKKHVVQNTPDLYNDVRKKLEDSVWGEKLKINWLETFNKLSASKENVFEGEDDPPEILEVI